MFFKITRLKKNFSNSLTSKRADSILKINLNLTDDFYLKKIFFLKVYNFLLMFLTHIKNMTT